MATSARETQLLESTSQNHKNFLLIILLVCVLQPVLLERPLAHERHRALLASVRTHVAVAVQVFVEAGPEAERFSAQLAAERFHARVHERVLVEPLARREPFRAVRTVEAQIMARFVVVELGAGLGGEGAPFDVATRWFREKGGLGRFVVGSFGFGCGGNAVNCGHVLFEGSSRAIGFVAQLATVTSFAGVGSFVSVERSFVGEVFRAVSTAIWSLVGVTTFMSDQPRVRPELLFAVLTLVSTLVHGLVVAHVIVEASFTLGLKSANRARVLQAIDYIRMILHVIVQTGCRAGPKRTLRTPYRTGVHSEVPMEKNQRSQLLPIATLSFTLLTTVRDHRYVLRKMNVQLFGIFKHFFADVTLVRVQLRFLHFNVVATIPTTFPFRLFITLQNLLLFIRLNRKLSILLNNILLLQVFLQLIHLKFLLRIITPNHTPPLIRLQSLHHRNIPRPDDAAQNPIALDKVPPDTVRLVQPRQTGHTNATRQAGVVIRSYADPGYGEN